MGLNTYPYSPFPASTEQLHKGDNEQIQAEIDQLKSDLTDLSEEVTGDATTYPYADVITIEDAVPSNLAGCVVKIEPVQSGSGDPSPTNVRPITGHTEVDVQRDGKNLYSGGEAGMINQGTGEDEPSGTVTRSYFINVGGGNSIALSHFEATSSGVRVFYYGKNKVYMTSQVVNFDANNSIIVSRPNGCEWIRFQASNSVFSPTTSLQVELGSTATPYEPYQGKTYTIALGDTIYGGTVDFDSGVMTVTMAQIASYDGETIGEPWISDRDVYAEGTTPTTGAQVVYTLAEPTTIQLTPQQIQLLKGQNTLTASTGQISVTVNGVNGAIGSVQTEINDIAEDVADIAEQLPNAPTTDGAYVLTVTVESGTPTYSWESAE